MQLFFIYFVSKAPGCPNDLWSKYVTKKLPFANKVGIDGWGNSHQWDELFTSQDLSVLETKVEVGNPYTIVFNITNKCKKSGVVIGFAGNGGFLKGNVHGRCGPSIGARAGVCFDRSTTPSQLVMVSGNWLGNGDSPTRLELRESCPSKATLGDVNEKMTIHNVHLFEGDDEVNTECVQW